MKLAVRICIRKMNEKYWSDYTTFLNKVQTLWRYSPADLIEFYTHFVVALENNEIDNYTFYEYELDNDFYHRTVIQEIIDSLDLKGNQLRDEFEVKILELDKRMIVFLTDDCSRRSDWYKKIDLKPSEN